MCTNAEARENTRLGIKIYILSNAIQFQYGISLERNRFAVSLQKNGPLRPKNRENSRAKG
jgi:hypothetical protein